MLFIQAKIADAFSTGEQRKSETTTNPPEMETNELNVSPSKVKIKEEILLDEVKDEIKMEITDDNFSTWVENKQHQKKTQNTTHRIYHLNLAHMW